MNKYRGVSRIVEAEQWFPETNRYECITVCHAFDGSFGVLYRPGGAGHTYISPGDYLVKSGDGEPGNYSPIPAEYFEADFKRIGGEKVGNVALVAWTRDDITPERVENWNQLTMAEAKALKQEAEEKINAIMGELYLATGVAFRVAESVARKSVLPGANADSYRAFYRTTIEATI